MASIRAHQLADAILMMTVRYGEAERQHAYAFEQHINTFGDKGKRAALKAEADQWTRAAQRRFRSIQRLTRCLAELSQ